jgi:phosphate starvation-inducible protein PhoH
MYKAIHTATRFSGYTQRNLLRISPSVNSINRGTRVYSSKKNFANYQSYDAINLFPSSLSYTAFQQEQIKQLFNANSNANAKANLQKIKTRQPLIARNPNQQIYIDKLDTLYPSIVVATGPAGSAKSYIAVAVGIEKLVNKQYKRLVITRPAVSVDEEMGFLPGSINEKMEPWMRPLYDTFYKYYSVAEVKAMIANKVIDICPIAYLRGRTLEDSYIIVDEAQNCTVNQMLMILTRIGLNSKMVITGDLTQHDRGFDVNGLGDFIQRLDNNTINYFNNIDDIAHVHFTEEDIERHPVIKDIMKLYSDTKKYV